MSAIRRELRLAIRALKTAPTRRAVRTIWDEVRDVQRDAHLLDARLAEVSR